MPANFKISVLIPAAGASSRMGKRHKLFLPFRQFTILQRTVNLFLNARFEEIIVICGDCYDQIKTSLADTGARLVCNEHFREGMGASIREGVKQMATDAEACLICPADMPFIHFETVLALCKNRQPGTPTIRIPVSEGNSGHPVLFSKHFFDDLILLSGDAGARTVIQNNARFVEKIEVADPGIFIDIDTPADYENYIINGPPRSD